MIAAYYSTPTWLETILIVLIIAGFTELVVGIVRADTKRRRRRP